MGMTPNRIVVAGAYGMALLLIIVPLSDMTIRVWPLVSLRPLGGLELLVWSAMPC